MGSRSVRTRNFRLAGTALFLCAVTLAGCDPNAGSRGSPKDPATTAKDAPAATAGHGAQVDLGKLTLASREFRVVRFGEVAPTKETAFEVQGIGMSDADLAELSLYLWVEAADGTQLSAPAKGDREGIGFHFHGTPRADKGDPHRVVLRVRTGGSDERGGLPLSGHGHEHHDGPHHGVLASFGGAKGTAGFLELKLHDDKGDLELWLAKNEQISEPFDLPLDAQVEVEFIDVANRKVTLRARDTTQNEDEDGNPNVRNGRTNYFIYPSAAGEDASWLQGKEFSSVVLVRFSVAGEAIQSEEFVLKPHVH